MGKKGCSGNNYYNFGGSVLANDHTYHLSTCDRPTHNRCDEVSSLWTHDQQEFSLEVMVKGYHLLWQLASFLKKDSTMSFVFFWQNTSKILIINFCLSLHNSTHTIALNSWKIAFGTPTLLLQTMHCVMTHTRWHHMITLACHIHSTTTLMPTTVNLFLYYYKSRLIFKSHPPLPCSP